MFAVFLNDVGSITPTPSLFGQISALVSFICHVWWPFGSAGPFASTIWTQARKWSRQYVQPFSDAVRNLTAVAWLALFLIQSPRTNTPSWSMPVPMLAILKIRRSLSWYSLPVSGFFVSSTWASSLYVIADAASISCFRNATMSKFCLTRVTSFFGSSPHLTSAACCSNSFPRIQTPYFLPFSAQIEL